MIKYIVSQNLVEQLNPEKEFEKFSVFLDGNEKFTPDQFYVRKMIVCNNFRDVTFERFSGEILKDFQKTLYGRALLFNHDHSQIIGKIYDPEIVNVSSEDVMKLVGDVPEKDFNNHLKQIEALEGLQLLVAKYYLPMITDSDKAIVSKHQTGLLSEKSIGAFVPLMKYVEDEKTEKLMYFEWIRDEESGWGGEAFEVSSVYSGAQRGAIDIRSKEAAAQIAKSIGAETWRVQNYLNKVSGLPPAMGHEFVNNLMLAPAGIVSRELAYEKAVLINKKVREKMPKIMISKQVFEVSEDTAAAVQVDINKAVEAVVNDAVDAEKTRVTGEMEKKYQPAVKFMEAAKEKMADSLIASKRVMGQIKEDQDVDGLKKSLVTMEIGELSTLEENYAALAKNTAKKAPDVSNVVEEPKSEAPKMREQDQAGSMC